MDSDEDEVSCDIPLDDGGGAAAAEEGSEGGSLDWSVSAISGGMDPDRFHSDAGAVSSSCPDSPEKTRLAEKRHHQLPANFGTRHTSRHADDDLDKLADKFKSIQANLEDISKKTLTPVNSPRREKQKDNHVNLTPPVKDPGPGSSSAARMSRIPIPLSASSATRQLDFVATTTHSHSQVQTKETTHTTSQQTTHRVTKFDQVRSVLRDLEGSAKNFKSSNAAAESRIPHRHSSQPLQDSVSAPKRSSFYDKEYEEVNAYLDRVNNRDPSASSEVQPEFGMVDKKRDNKDTAGREKDQSLAKRSGRSKDSGISSANPDQTSQNEGNATVICKKNNQQELDAIEAQERLSAEVKELRHKAEVLETQVKNLEVSNGHKQEMISELKLQWSSALKNWTKNQQELVDQLQESRHQVDNLKLENASAKEQFLVCQDELAKAVTIASNFRQKLSEEEAIKQDMLNQLLSERASKSKQFLEEQAKLQKAIEESSRLQQELNTLKEDNSSLVRANAELSKKLHDKDVDFAKERSELQANHDNVKHELTRVQSEKKTTESSLHTFYATQMEAILGEKIESLQANVQMWEKNLLRDKQDALNQLQIQHDAQVESIKKTIFDDLTKRFQDQLEEANLALSASQKEADALREQLTLKQSHPHPRPLSASPIPSNFGNFDLALPTSTPGGASTSAERQEQIWREVLAKSRRNSATPKSSNDAASSLVQQTIQNNFNYASTKTETTAYRSVSGPLPRRPIQNHRAFTSSESSPVMTKEEKRNIVRNFVKEYLDENPDAVLDARLMSGLNTMATNLVERTFEDRAASPPSQAKSRVSGSSSQRPPKKPSPTRKKSAKK